MTLSLHSSALPADDLVLTFGTAALHALEGPKHCEVRVWNENEFRRQGCLQGASVHVVVSDAHASARDIAARLAHALRAQLGCATAQPPLLAAEKGAVRIAARGGLAPGALRRVREFVTRKLAEKIELQQLADIAGLSVCHFSRAFKQSTGLPPHRYVVRERLQVAAASIRDTDRALADISLEVGFSDQSHFTRSFSEVMGVTPRDYRRKHR